MWELLVGAALLAGGYLLAKFATRPTAPTLLRIPAPPPPRQEDVAARRRQAEAEANRRQAARDMQLALQQLSSSPDFRRAASFATRAAQAGVPADFRQQQFRRLRPLLVNHLSQRLQAGSNLASATAGLRELMSGLGVEAYEAEYIVLECQGRHQAPVLLPPTFAERLRGLHTQHAQRMEAIRKIPELDDALREQLVEAEQERFRQELLDEHEQGK